MSKKKRSLFRDICLIAGVSLLAAALITLFFWQRGIHTSAARTAEAVAALRTLLPEPQGAVPEARRDNSMPVLSLEGEDYVGILEMPAFGSAQPVGAHWVGVSRYPCLFGGSVYDRSIQIGATTQKGQYGFYREISVGDTLYFTDMTGNRYTYTVTDIRYAKDASQKTLGSRDADLTLFIKNVYAFEYILVFCNIPD